MNEQALGFNGNTFVTIENKPLFIIILVIST